MDDRRVLSTLPPELIHIILEYSVVSLHDLLRLRRVCVVFSNLLVDPDSPFTSKRQQLLLSSCEPFSLVPREPIDSVPSLVSLFKNLYFDELAFKFSCVVDFVYRFSANIITLLFFPSIFLSLLLFSLQPELSWFPSSRCGLPVNLWWLTISAFLLLRSVFTSIELSTSTFLSTTDAYTIDLFQRRRGQFRNFLISGTLLLFWVFVFYFVLSPLSANFSDTEAPPEPSPLGRFLCLAFVGIVSTLLFFPFYEITHQAFSGSFPRVFIFAHVAFHLSFVVLYYFWSLDYDWWIVTGWRWVGLVVVELLAYGYQTYFLVEYWFLRSGGVDRWIGLAMAFWPISICWMFVFKTFVPSMPWLSLLFVLVQCICVEVYLVMQESSSLFEIAHQRALCWLWRFVCCAKLRRNRIPMRKVILEKLS